MSSIRLILGPMEVDLYAEERDGAVGEELSDNDRRCYESSTGDQDPVVGAARVRDGQRVESLGELIHNGRKVDDNEVRARRFSVRASMVAELAVEVVEERRIDPDGAALGHPSRVAAPSLAEMCASILRRVRSRRAGETLLKSVSKPARTIDWRWSGVSFSSSSAVQIFGAAMPQPYQARRDQIVGSSS